MQRQHQGRGRWLQPPRTSPGRPRHHTPLLPHTQALAKPDEEEVEKTVQETQLALERVVQNKLGLTNVKAVPAAPGAPQFIKYTPSQQGPAYSSGASHRIIKMHDMPVDPLEPPKFRHTKVPRGPGSPPVPVMHSPPRPVTAQDQADWKIPPCISNWKNNKVRAPFLPSLPRALQAPAARGATWAASCYAEEQGRARARKRDACSVLRAPLGYAAAGLHHPSGQAPGG